MFQSTLPHGERPTSPPNITLLNSFNPRSHMGSDGRVFLSDCQRYVSIHAPTWGATYDKVGNKGMTQFQSTLPHGERQRLSALIDKELVFQSTLPHGERQVVTTQQPTTERFNPRSHMGSDPHTTAHTKLQSQFQSTLPHGERRTSNL